MQIRELLESADHQPTIYLDMDGVQADFFGEWCERDGVDHWRSIENREEEIARLRNSSDQEVYDFFRNLKPLKGGMKLVAWLKNNNIPFTILSTPLTSPHVQASIQGKKDWMAQYNPGASKNAIFERYKEIYATTNSKPNILIDDYGVNTKAWENAGGIAIKYEDEYDVNDSAERAIAQLKDILYKDK